VTEKSIKTDQCASVHTRAMKQRELKPPKIIKGQSI